MQAIFEFIGAVIGTVAEMFLALIELAISLAALVVEFVYVALTQGTGEAKKRCFERRRALTANRDTSAGAAPKHRTISAPMILLLTAGIVIAVAGGILFESIQRKRKEQTERQIGQKADALVEEFKKAPEKLPQAGPLADRDAWGRPLELFIDKFPAGTLIVVRSQGRDGQPGTLDDLLAIKTSNPDAIDIGKEVVKRGIQMVKDRLQAPHKKLNLLPKPNVAEKDVRKDG